MKKRNPQKILIITAPFGGGHLTVANIVAESIKHQAGSAAEVRVLNVFEDWLPGSPRFFSKSYENAVKKSRSAGYKLFFNFSNARPKLVNQFCDLVFRSLGNKLLQRERPDVVISTFSILSYVAHKTLVSKKAKIPLISIITDAGEVHKLWLMGVEDAIITATPDTIDYAALHGVPRSKLHYFGFPVLEAFSRPLSQPAARRACQLKDMPTVLFTNGGLGMNPDKMLAIAEYVAQTQFPFQAVFVCGQNSELETALGALDFGDTTVQIHGFVRNMPQLMAASDIICTKAGWLTLSEALEVKRPIIMFDFIPGHERPNVRYIVESGFGELVVEPDMLIARLKALLGHDIMRRDYQKIIATRPSGQIASAAIARFVLDTANRH